MSDVNPLKFEAICSRPRWGPLATADCAALACVVNNIGYRAATGGPYWEQSLQNSLEDMIADGVDIAITYDFDSAFTPKDVAFMIQTMERRGDIDALAGLQTRRGGEAVLMQGFDGSGETTIKDLVTPLRMRTAHFGLTAIRLSRLKDIPQPWFLSLPSKSGSWRENTEYPRCDADIYMWRKWEEHKRTLYVHPGIRIGHIEDLVSKVDIKTGKTVHFYGRDWNDDHAKPVTVQAK